MLPGFENDRLPYLRLDVVASGEREPAEPITCVFDRRGGTLGRSLDNDLALPDTEGIVSRIHAAIAFHDDAYFLIDKSTNGTFLNNAQNPLDRGHEHLLSDGDTILIGSFSIRVSLLANADESLADGLAERSERLVDMAEPDAELDPFAGAANPLEELGEMNGWSSDARRPEWFPVGECEEAPEKASAGDAGKVKERPPVPVLHYHMGRASTPKEQVVDEAPIEHGASPPSSSSSRVPTGYVPFASQFEAFADSQLVPGTGPAEIPDDESGPALPGEKAPDVVTTPPPAQPSDSPPAASAERPVHTTRPVVPPVSDAGPQGEPHGLWRDAEAGAFEGAQLLEAFLRGLDVPSLQVPPEEAPQFMEQIGRMVHESVQGLIDTLRLRAEFKREFYVPATSIAPVENNLYKYSVNVDDAMSRMMSDSRSAYLGPAESTRQAFQDVAAHHLALIAGMESAVSTLLRRFSPEVLQEQIGKASVLEGVLPQYRKARMWEAFEAEYQQIADQAEEDFQEILGQNFARAYTEQIHRLERVGFGGRKGDNEQ